MKATDYLEKAIEAIGQRAVERDIEEERSAARAAELYTILKGEKMTEVDAWHFMCLLKLVRSATGKFKADDYVDLAGYAALAGEAAEKPFAPSQKTEEPSVVLCKESEYEDAREIIRADRGQHSGNVIGGSREPTPAERKEMLREGKL